MELSFNPEKQLYEAKNIKEIPENFLAFLAIESENKNWEILYTINIDAEKDENYFEVVVYTNKKNKKDNKDSSDFQLLEQEKKTTFLLKKTCPTVHSILDEKHITLCF
ncbi:MAG: hypothetical protein WCH65_01900 [bacterium]